MIRRLLTTLLLASAPLLAKADVPFLWGVTGTAGAPSQLYAINPANGKALRVGPTGFNNLSGLSVHPLTGVLYATQGQLGGTKSLVVVNPRTGKATPIGDLGEAIADTAFNAAGTFYIYGAATRDLYTANPATAAKSLVKADAATIGGCGITFDGTGKLYMTRSNSVAELNPANGNVNSTAVITGAASDIDNLLSTRFDGVIFGGQRTNKAAPTRLFVLDPVTGVTALASSVPLSLSGMSFDLAPRPGFQVRAGQLKTRSTSFRLKGNYKSKVPATISAGKASVVAKNGPWQLTVRRLKPGTNVIRLKCVDAVGQTVNRVARIIVES